MGGDYRPRPFGFPTLPPRKGPNRDKKVKKIKHKPTRLRLIKRYVESYYPSLRSRNLFADVATYCMFIGHGRSGSTLIGSLLDAHPSIIIAHELNALKHIEAGFSRRQLYYLLLRNSELYAAGGRKAGGYEYPVENQWQGKFDRLRVIGDKKATSAAKKLHSKPELLQKLDKVTGDKVRLIHVIRNPFDNITSNAKRRNEVIADSIRPYLQNCQTVMETKKQIEENPGSDIKLISVRHEAFIETPQVQLKELCQFLGIEPTQNYLDDCAAIVYESPNKSRHGGDWSKELIDLVGKEIERFPFLHGYSYDH